jgi:RNA polymerase sigma factor (sigma-70 family)
MTDSPGPPDARTAERPQPHRDPTEWGRLIESLDVAGVYVAIGSWLGHKLRAQVAVEDIWQETLWLSWRDREQHDWRGLSSFRIWLLSIARNRVHDAARNLGRKKRGGDNVVTPFSVVAGPDSVSGMLPPGSTTPSRIAGHRERAQAMEQALMTLEPDLRTVVQLRLFEEVPMREIAEQLHLPLSTAKERLLRGVTRYRFRLRALLGRDSAEGSQP